MKKLSMFDVIKILFVGFVMVITFFVIPKLQERANEKADLNDFQYVDLHVSKISSGDIYIFTDGSTIPDKNLMYTKSIIISENAPVIICADENCSTELYRLTISDIRNASKGELVAKDEEISFMQDKPRDYGWHNICINAEELKRPFKVFQEDVVLLVSTNNTNFLTTFCMSYRNGFVTIDGKEVEQ